MDDIITTGATMQAIFQSIKKAFPEAEQYFFILAKTKDKYGEQRCASVLPNVITKPFAFNVSLFKSKASFAFNE